MIYDFPMQILIQFIIWSIQNNWHISTEYKVILGQKKHSRQIAGIAAKE